MKGILLVFSIVLTIFQVLLFSSSAQAGMPNYPKVTTLPATSILDTSAVLNGNLYDMADPVHCGMVSFEWGQASGVYLNETVPQAETDNGTFSGLLTQLTPSTQYFYRAKVARCAITSLPISINGAGIGFNIVNNPSVNYAVTGCVYYGTELSFQTASTFIGTGSISGQSGGANGIGPTAPPINPSSFSVQNATIAVTKIAPGEKVDVAATVTNKGGSNGTSKVTLYINGQEAESKGVALSSGQSTTMHFSVSRNDPGTYTVYVNGVSAGSFTVDYLTNNDVLIYGIIALFTVGIISLLYMLYKRRPV